MDLRQACVMNQENEVTGRTIFSAALGLIVVSFVLALAVVGIVHLFG